MCLLLRLLTMLLKSNSIFLFYLSEKKVVHSFIHSFFLFAYWFVFVFSLVYFSCSSSALGRATRASHYTYAWGLIGGDNLFVNNTWTGLHFRQGWPCFFCFVFIFRCFWNLISNYYKLFIFNLIWINSLLFNYGCFYISSGKIGISLSKTLYTSGQSISWSVEFKPCFSEKYCISS